MSIQSSDTTTFIVDKSTETNITNYNTVTILEDTTPDTIISKENTTYILSECKQGPAGPPTGYTTEIDNLPFVGSGTGTFKTTTEINGNIIYEEFGLLDELFVVWTLPVGLDRSKDAYFEGTFFPVIDGISRTSSWEIHITAHNTATDYTGVVTATDLQVSDTSFTISHGVAPIDHVLYLDNATTTLHIKLKRIASSNDPNRVGVGDLAINYSTEGKVGIQGEQGEQGPTGISEEDVAYAKRTDFTNNDTIIYKGEAAVGTDDATALWRIRRLTIASDNDVTEEWADGTEAFTKTWTDRYTISYR